VRAKTAGQQRSKKEDRPGGEKLADEDFEEENGRTEKALLANGITAECQSCVTRAALQNNVLPSMSLEMRPLGSSCCSCCRMRAK
jgi:hypothetical protein